MKDITDHRDIDNIFFNDGYRLAARMLGENPLKQALIEIMKSAYASIDGLIRSFRRRCSREGLRIDCRKNCSWCCSQAVLVSTHEVLYIFSWMENGLGPGQKAAIREKALKKDRLTRGMEAGEFLRFMHPCPFLENKSCLIYPARPMACRIFLSMDAGSCRRQYENPGGQENPSLYEFPLRAGRLLNEGIRSALAQKRLHVSEWLMESFLCKAFADRQVFRKWLGGEDPFRESF